ncbi:class I SAM-dependent methyltransferase [Candidatus Daviesbacteria bacterium]|nr:class I SAM-dependent methyltransferase [Candidatus Daviesbacteria bacterium]
MELKYLKRALLWVKELSITLLKFWINNPKETPAILVFILEKLIASPRFFAKNVLVEKHTKKATTAINKTVLLYKKYGKSFDYTKQKSYEVLEPHLWSKFQILYFLVRKLKPKNVVETGVAAGESTGYILRALKDNGFGKLYSIDLPFQWYIYGNHKLHLDSLPAGKIPGFLVPANLKTNWKLFLGNTRDKLPVLLKELGEINIFFHDSEHSDKTMAFEYETCWPYIKKNGLLVSDDISYEKTFKKFTNKIKAIFFRFQEFGIIKK